MAKRKKKQTKTYPFSKTKFVKRSRKPTLFIRLKDFSETFREAIKGFLHPRIDEYNIYPLVYIWGSQPNGNLYSMEELSIIYNQKEEMYYLCIETAYLFKNGQEGWGIYLKELLEMFKQWMIKEGYDTEEPKILFMTNPSIELKAPSIEELYTNFKLFVNAFCTTYGVELDEDDYYDDFDDEDGDIYV